MNSVRLLNLIEAVVREQRPVVLVEPKGVGCVVSLHAIAQHLAAEEAVENMDPHMPSVAVWLEMTYEEVMAMFFMHPAGQPQCTKRQLGVIGEAKMRAFDALPDELRNRVIVDMLILCHAEGTPNWYKALANHDIEVAA